MAGRVPRGDGRPPAPAPTALDQDVAVYVISVAAELTGLHPQTLRTYERMGLITPGRTGGGGRRYSHRDIELLRTIADLTAAGTGIEGVRRILDLENRVDALTARNEELLAELAATREALREALTTRRTSAASGPSGPTTTSRVPAIRPPEVGQSVVVWRRGR